MCIRDRFYSMNKDGLKPRIVKIDGGMVANNWFSQFLADVINLKVIRPKVLEITALGAALFAGYQIGEFKSLNQIKNTWKKDKAFKPKINKNLSIKIKMKKILIVGAGAMGAAFSIPLLDNGHSVTLTEPYNFKLLQKLNLKKKFTHH